MCFPFFKQFSQRCCASSHLSACDGKKGKYHLEILEYKDSYQVLKRKQLECDKYGNVFTDNFASIMYYIRAE